MEHPKKILILGDSISSGIGSLKINYSDVLDSLLKNEYSILNLSLTGTTIHYPFQLLNSINDFNPDIVIIFYGNVDAQLRPNTKGKLFKRLPKRYQGGGMLIPRPLYSKKIRKNIIHQLDNYVRKILHCLIVNHDGYEQWVSVDEFTRKYTELVDNLLLVTNNLILVSTVYVDESIFPNSNAEYEKFNREIKRIAEINNFQYIDLFSEIYLKITENGWDSFYLKDHFHPNKKGYIFIAQKISQAIRSIGDVKNK